MFEAGDLLLIPFPYTDMSNAKRRPVLALTAPDIHGDFIGCPVTSRDRWANARRLLPQDMVAGVLPLPSWVRTDRVLTLNIALISSCIGRASEVFRLKVAGDVCAFIRAAPTVGAA